MQESHPQAAMPRAAILILSLLFLASSRFDLLYSVHGPPVITGLASTRADDVLKAAALILLCVWSMHSLFRHKVLRIEIRSWRSVLFLAYFAWCFLTYFWSDNSHLTGGRLMVLAATVSVAFAISLRFTTHDLLYLVFSYTLGVNLLGLCAEISTGAFRPWSSQYRFSGLWHPNTHGLTLALLVIAGVTLRRRSTQPSKWLTYGTAFGLVLLLLTRSRTSIASAIFVVALTSLMLAGARQRVIGVVSLVLVLLAGAFVGANGIPLLPQSAVSMGREDGGDAGTLTNRIPLWKDCIPYAKEHFWGGYGYGGFWNQERIIHITAPEEIAWNPKLLQYVKDGSFLPDAHNMYLEAWLETGMIGSVLLVALLTTTLLITAGRTLFDRSIDDAFIFSVFLWLCIEGCLEAITFQPCLPFLICPLLLAKTCIAPEAETGKLGNAPSQRPKVSPYMEGAHAPA